MVGADEVVRWRTPSTWTYTASQEYPLKKILKNKNANSNIRHDHPRMSTLTPWHSYANLTSWRGWRYTGCAKMNFLRQGFRKLSYYSLRLHAFIGVVTSRHVTKMAITPLDPPYPKTPSETQISWRYLLTGVLRDARSLHCGNGIFLPFAAMTFTRWPSYTNYWCVLPGDTLDVQIWTSYALRLSTAIVWQTYRQTVSIRQTIRVVTSGHVTNITRLD